MRWSPNIAFFPLILACGVFVACAGGGGNSVRGGAGVNPLPPASQLGKGRAAMRVVLTIPYAPSGTTIKGSRSPRYISSAAQTLQFLVYPQPVQSPPPTSAASTVVDVSPTSPACTSGQSGRTCTFQLAVNPGPEVIAAYVYASPNPAVTATFGPLLGQGSVAQTIVANAANPVNLTLSQVIYSVALSPSITTLASGGGASNFTVGLTAYDAANDVVLVDPSAAPQLVAIYAPSGLVSTAATANPSAVPALLQGGVVANAAQPPQFTYSGGSFINPMTVVGVVGTFSATAQLFPFAFTSPQPACAAGYAAASPLPTFDPGAVSSNLSYYVNAVLASETGGSGVALYPQVDTGSELFEIPLSDIQQMGPSDFIGPGTPGEELLTSDNNFATGNYYLVRIQFPSLNQETVPMEVLALSGGSSSNELMGVGFGRPASTPGPYGVTWKSSLMNAFLQLEPIVQGTSLHAGYVLAPSRIAVGLVKANTDEFTPTQWQQLAPDVDQNGNWINSGDWQTPTGCVSFNGGACQNGPILLDVGLTEMIADSYATPVPVTSVSVNFANSANSTAQPYAYSYSFPYPTTNDTPPAPPNGVTWRANSPAANLNTGIGPMVAIHYMYDEACGRAGYNPGS